MNIKYHAAIIGAGASGLMCAAEIAKSVKNVILIDHNSEPGKKILVSGGGRCNFTNLKISAENYISENPHFVKSALSGFSPDDFIDILKRHGIAFEEKSSGEMFCKKSAVQILEMFKKEISDVKLIMGKKFVSLKKDTHFHIKLDSIEIEADNLIIATGGLSYPSLGATDLGYKIARYFNINIVGTSPALVPIVFAPKQTKLFSKLAGISFRGRVSCNKKHFTGDILFTHRGLSGPAILQISSYWNKSDELTIDIIPDPELFSKMQKEKCGKKLIKNFLSAFISKRFAEIWCIANNIRGDLASCSDKDLKKICENIHNWKFTPAGTEGYKNAEATRGGVDTKEISSKTMEVLQVKNLYFIGEVLDVTGHLGGYNLHWAWASAHAAAKNIEGIF